MSQSRPSSPDGVVALREQLRAAMPSILRHEGTWRGTYRHLDAHGGHEDQHESEVRCEFPEEGPVAYRQHNLFRWPDGREQRAVLEGELREGRLWWETPTFRGSAWETHGGLILLDLERLDDPGARFYEIIVLGDGGRRRARTWHWFKQGRLYRRTLCDEILS